MKRILDEVFVKHMNKDNYVIAADIGYFPMARKHENFIDVGNNESCVGSVIEGIVSHGKHVYLYDVCGYVMKNSYASLFARNNTFYPKKGTLTIFGWGSGFAYDGCLLGHYPLDDCMIAHLLGLKVYKPKTLEEMKSFINYDEDKYIRMFDVKEYYYKDKPYNVNADIVFVTEGWLLGYLQKITINGFFGEKTVSIVPLDSYKDDCDHAFFLTDQVEDYRDLSKFKEVRKPLNPNFFNEVSSKYKDKKSCLKEWFRL